MKKRRKQKVQSNVLTEEELAANFGLAYIADYTSGALPIGLALEEVPDIDENPDWLFEDLDLPF